MSKKLTQKSEFEKLRILLDELCTQLGFCLPLEESSKILSYETLDPDEFADLVFNAEGMKPSDHLHLYRQVRNRFIKKFHHEFCNDNDQAFL